MKITILFSFTLLIAALVLAESMSVSVPKQQYWKIGDKFYYIEEVVKLNWSAAKDKCIEFGGHLVSLKNNKEHDDLKAYLNPNRNYWIDINDISKEGHFMSQTTGREATYLNWEPCTNNPDNAGGNENCGGLWKLNGNFLMNDFGCHTLMYFICEPIIETCYPDIDIRASLEYQ